MDGSRSPPIEEYGLLVAFEPAAREQRTVAIIDVEDASELRVLLPDRLELHAAGRARCVDADRRPDRQIGVPAHRTSVARGASDLILPEAVAAEAGLAVRLGRLLDENREQLNSRRCSVPYASERRAAARSRLYSGVEEATTSPGGRIDCYLFDTGAGRCVARPCAFDSSLVGFEFGATRGLAGAIREGAR